jgi:hypothetical protein
MAACSFYRPYSSPPPPHLRSECASASYTGTSRAHFTKHSTVAPALIPFFLRSRKGSEVPAGSLIFKNISSHGFWMTRWVEQSSVADRVKMLTHLEGLVRDGKLKLLLERASFDEWNSALHKNWESYRDRKVVMLMK